MTAISFGNKSKFKQALAIGGEDKMKVIEEYKKLSPDWREGTNTEIEDTKKWTAFYDLSAKKVKEAKVKAEKPKKVKKVAKKVVKKKKKK